MNPIFQPARWLLPVLLLLLASLPAGAAIINVTSIAALQSAINSAVPGDEIVLTDGIYTGTINITIPAGRNGITVRPATPGGAHLNGTVAVVIAGNHNTFSGFQFTAGSCANWPIEVQGSSNRVTQVNIDGYSSQKYINLRAPGQSNVVSYCRFRNKPATAPAGNLIHVDSSPVVAGYHRIRFCAFQDMPGPGGDNGNECIRLSNGDQSTNVSRTVVEHCYFNNTWGGDSEVISVKSRENVLRFNTFTNNQNGMMVFRNGDNNVAHGNFFLGAGGIRVKEANNVFCYNNYFERSGVGGNNGCVAYIFISPNLRNIQFLHNTFVECALIDFDTGATGNTWANNIFRKTTGDIFKGSVSGITFAGNLYQGTLGVPIASGLRNVDPQLVLNASGYHDLSSTSPAIDAASAAYPAVLDIAGVDDDPSILLDVSGQPRPASAPLKDVGCDEYGVNGALNRPLGLADVGPSYLGGPGVAVASPVFSVAPGIYTSAQAVAITSPTAEAGIRYTTDGSIPTPTTGLPYAGPVNIAATTTLQAMAYRVGQWDSPVSSASYTINLPGLPSPWLTADIGAVGLAGSATSSSGAFTVKGAGSGGLLTSSDQFRYVYQALSGDGSITARISSQSGTGTASLAGVMVRETTGANSLFAAMVHRGGGSSNMRAIRRTTTGGLPASISSTSRTPPNCWVQIVRTGNVLALKSSADGRTWSTLSSSTIPMAANITAGLVVTSGSKTVLDTDVFDNVTVVP